VTIAEATRIRIAHRKLKSISMRFHGILGNFSGILQKLIRIKSNATAIPVTATKL